MECSLPGCSIYGIFPGKNTWVCYHFLLLGIFPTQGSHTELLHCRWFLYHWATREALRFYSVQFSSVLSLSHVQLFVTPWTKALQASLSITNSRSLLKLMSIELVMPSNHLILCSSPSPLAFNFSQCQRVFKWVISLHQVAKLLEFQLQHQSFQWTPGTDLL